MTEQTSKQILSDAELESVVGGGSVVGMVAGMSGVTPLDLSGLDIETALMAVQSQRASLLENQLGAQLQDVQNRNAQIAALNEGLGGLQALMGRIGSGESLTAEDGQAAISELEALLGQSGVGPLDSDQDGMVSEGEVETMLSAVKGLIDAESNNQQMDMLRLQSLSNKRNEAFDTMTNFIKKMQDSRSSIIGNMR